MRVCAVPKVDALRPAKLQKRGTEMNRTIQAMFRTALLCGAVAVAATLKHRAAGLERR